MRRSHSSDRVPANYRKIGLVTIQAGLLGVVTCGCGGSPPPTVTASAAATTITPGSTSAISATSQRLIDDARQHIMNFDVVDTGAAGAPIILRGGRLGIDPSDPKTNSLVRNMRTLKELGVRTVIDLQGGDIQAKVHINRRDGKENKALGTELSLAIRKVNERLEPGETPQARQAEDAAAADVGIAVEHHILNSLNPIEGADADDIPNILKSMHDRNIQPVYVHCEHGHDRTGMIVALYRVCFDNKKPEDAYQEMNRHGHRPDDHVTQSTDIFFWRSMANETEFCNTAKK